MAPFQLQNQNHSCMVLTCEHPTDSWKIQWRVYDVLWKWVVPVHRWYTVHSDFVTDFLHVSTKAWTKSSIICIVTIRCRWFQRIYKSSHIMVCFLKKGVCQHKKLKPILFAIVILILFLFIIGGMLGLLPQPLFVLSSQTILVILVCGVALIIGLLLKFFDKKWDA